MKIADDLIEDNDKERMDYLRVRDMATEMWHKLVQEMPDYQRTYGQCPAELIALYLMAIKSLGNGDKYLEEDKQRVKEYMEEPYKKMMGTRNIQWESENSSQMEKGLWTLAAMREFEESTLPGDYESQFLDCIRGLERNNSHVLCLLLWLFPQFATEDRIKLVECMAMGNRAWLWRDKMLFWIACIKNGNHDQTKTIGLQICNLQLDSGGFATVEGRDEKENVISSAIGLAALVSCAGCNGLDDHVIAAAIKTVHWLAARLNAIQGIDELDRAWVLYALSKFINLH